MYGIYHIHILNPLHRARAGANARAKRINKLPRDCGERLLTGDSFCTLELASAREHHHLLCSALRRALSHRVLYVLCVLYGA